MTYSELIDFKNKSEASVKFNTESAAIIRAAAVQLGFSFGQKIFSLYCHPMYGILFSSEIFITSNRKDGRLKYHRGRRSDWPS